MPRKKLLHLAVAAAATCAAAVPAAPALAATSIHGAGSTLVAPLEAEWATAFGANTGITVNYDAVGSGTGIQEISQNLVDFGASDAPLNQTQAAQCSGCVMVPWALSATGVGFHLNGVHRLRLSGAVLAKIYLGQITNWNSPAIRRLNKGVRMPNLTITPIFRTDGSGDTYAFTNFLSSVSGAFRRSVGVGTQVNFKAPHQAGAKGNSGVTSLMESTNGSVAYIAVSYLIARSLPAVAVQNKAGNFIYPNLRNIENAAQTVRNVPSNNAISIVNPPRSAKIAYPISTFTYAIAHRGVSSAVKRFIKYAISPSGQQFAPGLDFAALPSVVVRAAQRAVNGL